MALSLSTLTSPSNNSVLEEINTTADFLEGVPLVKNLARGSNAGGSAKQDVALNQPRALPLIKNPQGNLGGYLYIPDVSGNYATGPSVTIGANQTWEGELDMVVTQWGSYVLPMGGGDWTGGFGLLFYPPSSTEPYGGEVQIFSKGAVGSQTLSGVTLGTPFNVKFGWNGTNGFVDIDGVRKFEQTAPSQAASITHTLELNQQTLTNQGNYAIQKAKLTVNNAVVFDCDFNGSTSIRHGDKKFKAAVGGFVSIASPELIPNGNFDTDTAWTKTGGWSIADGVATLASVPGSSDLGSTVISVTAGKTYKIVVNVIATSGSFRLYDTGGVVAYSLNVGENVFSRVATGSSYQLVPLSIGSGTATIDSISVTEVSPDAKRDQITIIKKSVLRFDGVNDFMEGVFNQTVPSGYLFAAFSVLGDGGQTYGRIFGINSTGSGDNDAGGFSVYRAALTNNIDHRYDALAGAVLNGLFDDAMGDVLLESSFENNSQKTKINNANEANGTTTLSGILSAQEFKIAAFTSDDLNPSIDLEFLALFSVDSVPDEATAKRIRDYINGRGAHPIYLRHQSDGYYFYDATKGPVGAIQSGSTAWSGRIVGSDNGDSATLLATQSTINDAPVGDGFKVTFSDNTDHLDIPSTTQAGWQIVGTSLGTFVYKVNNTAVTELNLLGNAGAVRSVGDLYGIILLPESATGADIKEARELLIDKGAADKTTGSSLQSFWLNRHDIVEFENVNFSNVTNFVRSWKNCSSLQSFPSGAKLGTEVSNVNFTGAWQSSGLTSFSTPLPTATTILSAWRSSSITSFSADLPLAIDAREAWLGTPLRSFSTPLPLVTKADYSWFVCSSITNFSAPLPVVESVFQAWLSCTSLTDFSADVFANWNPSSITSGVFNLAWDGCSALSAQSVENILTSIAASNQYATVDGNSGSAAIADAGIDIDYNAASGSLSAATNTAVSALKGRGWSIIVNNVTL